MKRTWISYLIGLLFYLSFIHLAWAEPSDVYIDQATNKLMVKIPEDAGYRPYIIKGINWQPATRAPEFFFDWDGREPQGHILLKQWLNEEMNKYYEEDILLMRAMNVNTVRIFQSPDNTADLRRVMDKFFANGIMVILTLNPQEQDFDAINMNRYEKIIRVVEAIKGHSALLFWSIGNEWNLNNFYFQDRITIRQAATACQQIAELIKNLDNHHPIVSCLGDRFDAQDGPGIPQIVGLCPAVDIWSLNIYRGESFGELFAQWKEVSSKPFFISEFGTDSYRTASFRKFTPNDINDRRVDDVIGDIDEQGQAGFIAGLFAEIEKHLSLLDYNQQCLGGALFEFNDELWKVGSFHSGLGNLVNYAGPDNRIGTGDDDSSYDEYNAEGFYLEGHPDQVANEEYFGVVDAERRPKKAFYATQHIFARFGKPQMNRVSRGPRNILRIYGQNFGQRYAESKVEIIGRGFTSEAKIIRWSPTAIYIQLPQVLRSETYTLRVFNEAGVSNRYHFPPHFKQKNK